MSDRSPMPCRECGAQLARGVNCTQERLDCHDYICQQCCSQVEEYQQLAYPQRKRGPRQPYMRAGEKHARWTVLEDARLSTDRVLCRCNCGTAKRVLASSVKDNERRSRGVSKSCGCHRAETTRQRSLKYGLSTHPLRSTWYHMVDRCSNPQNSSYADYGGRGIKVCDRWLGQAGLANFIGDMGPKPSPQHTLERLNNDGDYEPANCGWATWVTQAANKRPAVKNAAYGALAAEVACLRRENEQLRRENEQLLLNAAVTRMGDGG